MNKNLSHILIIEPPLWPLAIEAVKSLEIWEKNEKYFLKNRNVE